MGSLCNVEATVPDAKDVIDQMIWRVGKFLQSDGSALEALPFLCDRKLL